MTQNIKYMSLALDLAKKGAGRVSPNPLVGCVIVKGNKIVGQGYHKKCGSHHAEVNALRQAGKKAKAATMYVTLEPCHHFGKTPPCVDAVIKAGIGKVVMAMKDPNPLTNGKSVRKLKAAKISVLVGTCGKEAQELNRYFISALKNKKPFVICKVGQSLDGMISTAKGKQGWMTGNKSKQYVQKLRSQVDAVLVGDGTVKIDNPQLNVRNGKKPQPRRVVLDPFLNIKSDRLLFKVHGGEVILVSALKDSDPKVKKLRKKGIQVISNIPVKGDELNLTRVMKELFKLGIHSILVEGGARIFQSLLKTKLVDEWRIIVAPKVIGSKGVGWMKPGNEKKFKVKKVESLGEDEMFVC